MTREIKGPEDCIPHESDLYYNENMTIPDFFTAQEVGQIIALAMDAAENDTSSGYGDKKAKAWREIAERLRSGK